MVPGATYIRSMTQIRNKDVGKPGNGGEFAGRTRRAPEVDLSVRPDYSAMTTHREVEEAFVARYNAAKGNYDFRELWDVERAHDRIAGDGELPLTFSGALSTYESMMSPENIAADGERSAAQQRAQVAWVTKQFTDALKALNKAGAPLPGIVHY